MPIVFRPEEIPELGLRRQEVVVFHAPAALHTVQFEYLGLEQHLDRLDVLEEDVVTILDRILQLLLKLQLRNIVAMHALY